MKSSVEIRKMKPEDLPVICDLYQELVQGCRLETMRDNYEIMNDQENYYFLVAECENKVLGTATVIVCHVLDCTFLTIENVVVAENARGLHIGKRIFEKIDVLAEHYQCQYAILVSSGFRKGAHQFYEAMGYADDVRGFRKNY